MAQSKKSLENFICRRCGFCCSLSGYVILKEGEAERIAEFLGMDIYDFTQEYTILVNGRRNLSLTEQENGRCIFLMDDNTCRIQSVKPSQCIGFPHLWRNKELEKGCEGFKAFREAKHT
jgi:Fe-S-cluster containining protein